MFNLDDFLSDKDRDICRDREGCRTVVHKHVEVRTPVALDVNTRRGDIRIACAEPRIDNRPTRFDCNSGRCEFTVVQRICVEIPINYRVRADVGSSFVDCDIDTRL